MKMTWEKLLCQERRRPTSSTGDHRVQFERDYDRSIFSTPVRRLQDKTQVFPLDPNDAVRTRLTHSLEVSALARGIAKNVSQWLLKEREISAGQDRCIEAIAATCGLLHDLGNPPFGHSGEEAIRTWFKKHEEKIAGLLGDDELLLKDFLRFDGNAQTLRLVATLQVLSDLYGLNLTFGTLSALCKYTAGFDEINKENHNKSKLGYFQSEKHIIEDIRIRTGTGDARNPITLLVEAADDIVYSVCDIEDAVKKKIVSWQEVEEEGRTCEPMRLAVDRSHRILHGASDAEKLPDDIRATAFRTSAIGMMVKATTETFVKNYGRIMQGDFYWELLDISDMSVFSRRLKKIASEKAYRTQPNLRLELMGRHIIADLMDVFYEGVLSLPLCDSPSTKTFEGKAAALLSNNYRHVFRAAVKESGFPENYLRLQLLCDYICGMTDSFAQRFHTELFNG